MAKPESARSTGNPHRIPIAIADRASLDISANRLIAALRGHGARAGHKLAIDPVEDFPVDYYLLSEMVGVLACDMAMLHRQDRPVAVQMGHGLPRALLDLALVEAGIPQLALPEALDAASAMQAMAWSGAQAGYLHGTARMVLRGVLPLQPLPQRVARVGLASGGGADRRQVLVPVDRLIAMAEALVPGGGNDRIGRHLALHPAGSFAESVAGFYAVVLAGGTYVVPPARMIGLEDAGRPDFARLAEALGRLRITSLVVDRPRLAGLVSALERAGGRPPLLARVIVADGPVGQSLRERCRILELPVETPDLCI